VHAAAIRATAPTTKRSFRMAVIQPEEPAYGDDEPMKIR
jgi:hypothetical protein